MEAADQLLKKVVVVVEAVASLTATASRLLRGLTIPLSLVLVGLVDLALMAGMVAHRRLAQLERLQQLEDLADNLLATGHLVVRILVQQKLLGTMAGLEELITAVVVGLEGMLATEAMVEVRHQPVLLRLLVAAEQEEAEVEDFLSKTPEMVFSIKFQAVAGKAVVSRFLAAALLAPAERLAPLRTLQRRVGTAAMGVRLAPT